MGQWFSHWDDDPYYVDSYNSPFIYYFDIILLPISCIIVTIIFSVWIFELFCSKIKKKINESIAPKTKEASSVGSETGSNAQSSGKPKIDLSIPTISKTQQPSQESMQQKLQKRRKSPSKRHQEIHAISKILTTTSICCAMVYLWCTLSIVILSTNKKHPDCIWISLNFEIVYTQRYCLYLYYLFRAYVTFQNSSHEISKKKMIILVSVISTVWVFGEIFYIVWNSIINDCTEGSNLISIIPLGVTETCTSSFCVWLFYSKLRRIYSRKMQKADVINYRLQYLFSKLMILAGAAIGTTFCVLSFWPFTFAFGLMAIDTPINVICMVLSFAFYDKYYKVLCVPCRRCFEPIDQSKEEPLSNDIQVQQI